MPSSNIDNLAVIMKVPYIPLLTFYLVVVFLFFPNPQPFVIEHPREQIEMRIIYLEQKGKYSS